MQLYILPFGDILVTLLKFLLMSQEVLVQVLVPLVDLSSSFLLVDDLLHEYLYLHHTPFEVEVLGTNTMHPPKPLYHENGFEFALHPRKSALGHYHLQILAAIHQTVYQIFNRVC